MVLLELFCQLTEIFLSNQYLIAGHGLNLKQGPVRSCLLSEGSDMYSEPLVLQSTGARSSAVHQCVCVLSFLSASLLMLCSSVQLSANRHLHRDTTVAHTLLQIRILNPWWLSKKKKKCKRVCVCVFYVLLVCLSADLY